MLLLKAKEHNWGLIGPGDWEKRSWKISDDGWYSYTVSFRSGSPDLPEIPSVTEEGVFSRESLQALRDALNADWTDEESFADDGSAWEFKMYQDDAVIRHRKTGYIYGIEPYETIADLLYEETVEEPEEDTDEEVLP